MRVICNWKYFPYSDSMLTKASRVIQVMWYYLFGIVFGIIALALAINLLVTQSTKSNIYLPQHIPYDVDAVVVLWASVAWMKLSPILQDRVETAIQLYQAKKTKRIIISWYNSEKYYKEVDAMLNYLKNRSIPEQDIIIDQSWVNTFNSIRNIHDSWFKKVGIITQNFHLPRALFLAKWVGVDAVGISSDRAVYNDIEIYEKRELLAQIKAIFEIIWFYILPSQ